MIKRQQVVMPSKPPYEVLCAMVGDPLIFAASDEQRCREIYATVRRAIQRIEREKRIYADTTKRGRMGRHRG
jgi:hypothetical protein